MKTLPTKRQEENYTGSYSKGLKNQNGEYLVNTYESNKLDTQVISFYSELAKFFFLWKYNNLKVNVSHRNT